MHRSSKPSVSNSERKARKSAANARSAVKTNSISIPQDQYGIARSVVRVEMKLLSFLKFMKRCTGQQWAIANTVGSRVIVVYRNSLSAPPLSWDGMKLVEGSFGASASPTEKPLVLEPGSLLLLGRKRRSTTSRG